MPGPVRRATVAVLAYADVQENDNGTWSAIAYLDGRSKGCATGETREAALSKAADLASVQLIDIDHPLSQITLVDDMIEVGREMAGELTIHIEKMRQASGDERDGEQIAVLVDRWNNLYAQYRAWLEEDQ